MKMKMKIFIFIFFGSFFLIQNIAFSFTLAQTSFFEASAKTIKGSVLESVGFSSSNSKFVRPKNCYLYKSDNVHLSGYDNKEFVNI